MVSAGLPAAHSLYSGVRVLARPAIVLRLSVISPICNFRMAIHLADNSCCGALAQYLPALRTLLTILCRSV